MAETFVWDGEIDSLDALREFVGPDNMRHTMVTWIQGWPWITENNNSPYIYINTEYRWQIVCQPGDVIEKDGSVIRVIPIPWPNNPKVLEEKYDV
jgi:hypothetical protein